MQAFEWIRAKVQSTVGLAEEAFMQLIFKLLYAFFLWLSVLTLVLLLRFPCASVFGLHLRILFLGPCGFLILLLPILCGGLLRVKFASCI